MHCEIKATENSVTTDSLELVLLESSPPKTLGQLCIIAYKVLCVGKHQENLADNV